MVDVEDDRLTVTVINPETPPAWWTLIFQWWNNLPLWKKALILVGGVASSAGATVLITQKKK